jgi:hypothetical protein
VQLSLVVASGSSATAERTTVAINPRRSILIVRLRFTQMHDGATFFGNTVAN